MAEWEKTVTSTAKDYVTRIAFEMEQNSKIAINLKSKWMEIAQSLGFRGWFLAVRESTSKKKPGCMCHGYLGNKGINRSSDPQIKFYIRSDKPISEAEVVMRRAAEKLIRLNPHLLTQDL